MKILFHNHTIMGGGFASYQRLSKVDYEGAETMTVHHYHYCHIEAGRRKTRK